MPSAPLRAPRAVPSAFAPAAAAAVRELALQPTDLTPYDRYMGTLHTVIAELDGRGATMAQTCAWMKVAHHFRYESGDPYRAALPEITALTEAGDCKAKALWLYSCLGDPSALYVIGKIAKDAKNNHAWLYWRSQNRWWILDPTNRSEPVAADSVSRDRYLPHYSFGPGGAYRHTTTQLFMAQIGEGQPSRPPAKSARANFSAAPSSASPGGD